MGGISKFQGSKGANQYEKYGIIRFELPFDAWCMGCKRHMSKGLRFNAKKDKAGKYFSTTIWAFTTKCPSCDQQLVIKTDPQNNTYEFAEGLRKHEQEYEADEADGAVEVLSLETKAQLNNDAMFRLEHTNTALAKARTANQRLEDLIHVQEETAQKDYDMNALLRSKNRAKRKHEAMLTEEGRSKGFSFPMADLSSEDQQIAQCVDFRANKIDQHKRSEQRRMAALRSQPIIANKAAAKPISAAAAKLAHKFGLRVPQHTVSAFPQVKVCQKTAKGGDVQKM